MTTIWCINTQPYERSLEWWRTNMMSCGDRDTVLRSVALLNIAKHDAQTRDVIRKLHIPVSGTTVRTHVPYAEEWERRGPNHIYAVPESEYLDFHNGKIGPSA